MKISFPLVKITALPLMLLSTSEATAQQAPIYNYQQAPAYPQSQYASPAPVYRQAPTYSQPQRYAQPTYPQQRYAQPSQSQYVSPSEFLPTFGRKFGDMFRRVFYGDRHPSGY